MGETDGASVSSLYREVFNDGGGTALWVGGAFTGVSGITANRIAKYDGVRWTQPP